jgi:hypothetical protein
MPPSGGCRRAQLGAAGRVGVRRPGEVGCSGAAAMCLRFVVTGRGVGCPHRQGVFGPAYDLLWGETLSTADYDRLREILDCLNANLPGPDRSKLEPGAIFWFKPGGDRSVKRIWDLVAFLREHAFHVELIKARRPGRICYEDAHQVAATPFRDQSF